jgi:hypothetical protein
MQIPEDMALVLDEKKKLFWTLRGNLKSESSFAAYKATRSLQPKRRRKKIFERFEGYCQRLGTLIDDAVPTFVELASRLDQVSFHDRIASVQSHVEECIITPSTTRDSVVRWLADACEGHPRLEVLVALHKDPSTWIAPRWLTPSRTRVEKREGYWFFVTGSRRTRITKQLALEYKQRLKSLPVNLPTTDLVGHLDLTIRARLAGIFERALAKCIERLLPAGISQSETLRSERSDFSLPQAPPVAVADETPIKPEPKERHNCKPSSHPPPSQPEEESPQIRIAASEIYIPEDSQHITDRTFFVIEAKALVHSRNRPGELVGAYSTKGPYMTDTTLLCYAPSSLELLQKLRDMHADHQFLLIHWGQSEEKLKQLSEVLRAYLSLKETARTVPGKPIEGALQELRSFFESEKKRRGRPRQDTLRERVKELRSGGQSWGEIHRKLNKETGVERTIGAYRNLVRPRRKPYKG